MILLFYSIFFSIKILLSLLFLIVFLWLLFHLPLFDYFVFCPLSDRASIYFKIRISREKMMYKMLIYFFIIIMFLFLRLFLRRSKEWYVSSIFSSVFKKFHKLSIKYVVYIIFFSLRKLEKECYQCLSYMRRIQENNENRKKKRKIQDMSKTFRKHLIFLDDGFRTRVVWFFYFEYFCSMNKTKQNIIT